MKLRTSLMIALLAAALVPGATAQSYTLSGQVVDQDGTPVAGVDVYLYQWGAYDDTYDGDCAPEGCEEIREPSYHEAQAVTDAQGRYSLAAQSGWANLNFQKAGYNGEYRSLELNDSQTVDVQLLKFPDKTARIEGRVTGAGNALPFTSISAENPEWGTYECSVIAGERDQSGYEDEIAAREAESGSASSDMAIAPGEPYPGYSGCAITIDSDGTYSGNVTPGYTILRFYHQDWREQGGQQFYSKSLVRTLAADSTTRIDVDLVARPGPDAILQGYVVDEATKEAIPGVQISFSSMDSYGWANVQSDKEGSYKVRIHSGITQVYVYADGYFPWEGDVVAKADGTVRFDIHLTAGQSRYGGCCIAYAEGDGEAAMDGARAPAPGGSDDTQGSGPSGDTGPAEATAFEDLGGGLGPYDAASAPQGGDAASDEPGVEDTPGFEVLAVLMALVALVLLRRR